MLSIKSHGSNLAVFSFAFLLGVTPAAWSQSTATGTVSGQVIDAQNAAIAGTVVKLTSTTTRQVLTTTTNDTGRYVFLNVNPGTYDLSFTKEGFEAYRVNTQNVIVGQVLTINAQMAVGATTTTVEVTSVAGAELQTANSTVGTTINSDAMTYLPNFGREATTLAIFQPGVSPEGTVAGAMSDQNTYQLDGMNNSDDMDGSANVYNPRSAAGGAPTGAVPTPIESVEEFKINTSGQTADFNGSSGAQIQMVTKRGTNQFHGAAYEYYYATDVGAANNWDANHTPSGNLGYTPLPITHNNRFGAALGGQLIPKRVLGGKWYFFVNYEGFRFPNSSIIQRNDPTDLLRAGVIQITEGSQHVAYNLNPTAVTVGGTTYQPAVCPAGSCDPRGLGLNSVVSQVWKLMPGPNVASGGDKFNYQGFQGVVGTPTTSNNYVGRIDHDFSDKWRLMVSYRDYRYVSLTTNQLTDAGGHYVALAPRPLIPSSWTAGLSTNVTPNLTNDFRFNYVRNFWQWGTAGAIPQLPGLNAALEIGGETVNALQPYNVNTQQVRQRFWDGQDKSIRDDVTWIHGNHLITAGGQYQRNFDYHQRTDNGGGIMNQPVDQIGPSSGFAPGVNFPTQYIPTGVPTAQYSTYERLYEMVLGIVTQPQTLYTRSGPQLTLNPPGTPMFDQSIIPSYNLYFTDTWHARPTLTITYGLGYDLEMPPYEINGKQILLTDTSGTPIQFSNYFAQRQASALQGQVYNPLLAYTNISNVKGASTKYPYNPFYGGLSPRVSAAWNPHFSDDTALGKIFGNGKTVIRAGYGRIFGRLNGVDLVLIPLLGTGLGQPISCLGASSSGQCLGNGGVTPATAFRIGTDGLKAPLPPVTQTLTEPFVPGGATASAGSGSVLDPNFRPSRTDNLTVSIQRELFNQKAILEVGYIGRLIRNEWQEENIDAVPYMTTLGGQSFAQAYANTYWAVQAGGVPAPQAFFEAALGGANSAFCKGFGSCTAAVAKNSTMNGMIANTQVYDLWAALEGSPGWTLGRTMPSSPLNGGQSQVSGVYANTSAGYGNYNAGYVSFTTHDWHGFTARSNFTWGRALGTGNQVQASSEYTVLDPWNLQSMYGPQYYDYKFIYSLTVVYHPPFFRTQKGVAGHILGGWTIAPILYAHSGSPLMVNNFNGNCESFGEGNCSTGNTLDGAVLNGPFTFGHSAHFNQTVTESSSANPLGIGTNANADNGGQNVQMYADPIAAYNDYRNCVLGFDTNCGSNGNIRGLNYWNVDATVSKDLSWHEGRIGATLIFQFQNIFNHVILTNPYLDISDPADFGVLGTSNPNGGQANTPRNIEFGVRVHF